MSSAIGQADARAIREVVERVSTFCDGEAPILELLTGALLSLFRAHADYAYAVQYREGYELRYLVSSGLTDRARASFEGMVRGASRTWGDFDPLRPQVEQRNRALRARDVERGRGPSAVTKLQRSHGISDSVRVLVCEGPALLSNYGFFKMDGSTFGGRERRLLQALTATLHDRLVAESLLPQARLHFATIEALLEATGGAALLVDREGRVVLANAVGASRLTSDDTTIAGAIRDALRGRPSPFRVLKIEANGVPPHALLVEHARESDVGPRVDGAAARWGLTPRQRAVLAELAHGRSNKVIAAVLGIAEGTVELHVTAILQKADVESRAELVAKVWSAG